MSKFNFDEPIERRDTQSFKWDLERRHFGCDDVLGMWTADMDFRCPKPMLDAFSERIKHGVFGYTIRNDKYYDIILDWIKRRFAWSLTAEDIHYCPPGVIPAACMLVSILTGPGDAVSAFMPNYDSLYGAAESMGRRLVTADLLGSGSDSRLNLKEFERIVKEEHVKLALFCSPHNPVGRVWSEGELEEFAAICEKYDVFVVSDEVHCDIIRKGLVHTPLGKIPAMASRSAVLMSPNKTFNVGGLMTASVIIQNRGVMERFKKVLGNWAMTLDTTFGTIAVETLYSDPGCEEWLEAVNEYLTANLEYAAEYINANIPGVSTYVPEGTYLLWLDFSKTPYRGEELQKFLVQKAGIDMCEGWDFDSKIDDHMRLNCACTRATLEEAMKRLTKAFE